MPAYKGARSRWLTWIPDRVRPDKPTARITSQTIRVRLQPKNTTHKNRFIMMKKVLIYLQKLQFRVLCTVMFTIGTSGHFRVLQFGRWGIHGESGHNLRSRRGDRMAQIMSRSPCPCTLCTALNPSSDDSPPLDFPHLHEHHRNESPAWNCECK